MPGKRTFGEGAFDKTGPAPLFPCFPFMPDRSWYAKAWLEEAGDRPRAERPMPLLTAFGERPLAAAQSPARSLEGPRQAAAACARAPGRKKRKSGGAAPFRPAA